MILKTIAYIVSLVWGLSLFVKLAIHLYLDSANGYRISRNFFEAFKRIWLPYDNEISDEHVRLHFQRITCIFRRN